MAQAAEGFVIDDYALDWSRSPPCVVPYLGRLAGDQEDDAVVMHGSRRVVVPHVNVFWLGSACGPRSLLRLSPQVGAA